MTRKTARDENHESNSPLPEDASSASRARRIVHETLAEWGLYELADVASLLASELVANVVLHAQCKSRLEMHYDDGCLRIGVWDASSIPPARHRRSRLAATGRGLALVDALASRWGWEPSEQGGKVVWFEVRAAELETGGSVAG